MKKNTDPISTSYVDIMEKNHMEIPWHDYTGDDSNCLLYTSPSPRDTR